MTKQLTVSRLLIPLHSLGLFEGLHVIDQIDPSNHHITLCARLSGTAASCPGCRTESRRVQGHYWRCLGDLPCCPVILRVQVRRFRCVNDACPRRTFGEPLPRIARAEPAIPSACAPLTTPSPWRWAAIQERTWPPGSAWRDDPVAPHPRARSAAPAACPRRR